MRSYHNRVTITDRKDNHRIKVIEQNQTKKSKNNVTSPHIIRYDWRYDPSSIFLPLFPPLLLKLHSFTLTTIVYSYAKEKGYEGFVGKDEWQQQKKQEGKPVKLRPSCSITRRIMGEKGHNRCQLEQISRSFEQYNYRKRGEYGALRDHIVGARTNTSIKLGAEQSRSRSNRVLINRFFWSDSNWGASACFISSSFFVLALSCFFFSFFFSFYLRRTKRLY